MKLHDKAWFDGAWELTSEVYERAEAQWISHDYKGDSHFELRKGKDGPFLDKECKAKIDRLVELYEPLQKGLEMLDPTELHKADMLVTGLALWLVGYFLGVPDAVIWQRLSELVRLSGQFPTEAFYCKLAGDVFRLQKQRGMGAPEPPQNLLMESGGILAVAYQPTIILDALPMPAGPAAHKQQFRDQVRALSERYLRFHVARYVANGLPLTLLVSRLALSEAIEQRALISLNAKKSTNYAKWSVAVQAEGSSAEIVINEELSICRKRIEDIFGASDTQNGVPADLCNNQFIVLAPFVTMRWKGITSCALSESDAAIGNRPNRRDDPIGIWTSWASEAVLRQEQEKVRELLGAVIAKRLPGFVFERRSNQAIKEVFFNELYCRTWEEPPG